MLMRMAECVCSMTPVVYFYIYPNCKFVFYFDSARLAISRSSYSITCNYRTGSVLKSKVDAYITYIKKFKIAYLTNFFKILSLSKSERSRKIFK